MRIVTEAIRCCAHLNAAGARSGARLVAFNALLMAQAKAEAERTIWTPSGRLPLPANDHASPPSAA